MKNSRETQPNYRLRRFVAGTALAAAALGIGHEGMDYIQTTARHNEYVDHPNTIPASERVYVPVKAGDTADGLALSLTPKGEDYRDLSLEIQNQADKNHLLQPGQELIVEDRLVDHNSETYRLQAEHDVVASAHNPQSHS